LDLSDVGSEGGNWIETAQDHFQWLVFGFNDVKCSWWLRGDVYWVL